MFSEKRTSSVLKVFLVLVLLQGFTACGIFYTKQQVALYNVETGDTLGIIAKRFHTTSEKLRAFNGLKSADIIRTGQVLEIPVNDSDPLAKDSVQLASRGSRSVYASRQPTLVRNSINHQKQIYVLNWPARNYTRLSSKFGRRWSSFHEGIDLAAKTGTPVYAAHSGKVVVSGYQLKGYGKMVIIQNKDLLTVYAHHNRNRVTRGQYVNAGQHIADVGSTGHSTGPHLHFEVRLRNSRGKFAAVNPLSYLPKSR